MHNGSNLDKLRTRTDINMMYNGWWLRSVIDSTSPYWGRCSIRFHYASGIGYVGYIYSYPINYTGDVPLVCVI